MATRTPEDTAPPVRLAIQVVPGSSRSGIESLGEGLKIRVKAPPERGKANAEVVRLVSRALAVPRSAVRIVAGGSGRRKLLEIDGLPDAAAARRRLLGAG